MASKIDIVLDAVVQAFKELKAENKQWETNYNNLSAEFEEVSAIAQAQAKEIEELARAIVNTWDNIFSTAPVSAIMENRLEKARAIFRGGK